MNKEPKPDLEIVRRIDYQAGWLRGFMIGWSIGLSLMFLVIIAWILVEVFA